MRDRWTDERLDDLNAKVDRGFDRIETELRSQRAEISGLRTEMNARFEKVDDRFDAINARFDSLNRTLLAAAVAVVVALIGARAIPF